MILVFDTENNNLLRGVSKFHCGGAIDVASGREYWYGPDQLDEFLALLDEAETIVAHNINGYDIPALQKIKALSGESWVPKAHIQCTLVMSQVMNFQRFNGKHSLGAWGKFFEEQNEASLAKAIRQGNKTNAEKFRELRGTFYKGDYKGGFETFNPEMFDYMKQDVRLGLLVYKYLRKEIVKYIKSSGSKGVLTALTNEIRMDEVMTRQSENGWLFNKEGAEELLIKVEEEIQATRDFINPMLNPTVKVIDPDTKTDFEPITGKRHGQTKTPTYTKAGKLNQHLINWFGLPDDTDVNSSPFFRESLGFCRVDFIDGDVGNTTTVKNHLYTIGWKPDEWNWERVGRQFVKKSAKLSDSSLEPLGEIGQLLMKYYTLRSRKSIIEGWFTHIDEEGRLHGDVFNIGTPTFRQTHKIIANLPSGKAELGPEIRALFIAPPGRVLVSGDSAACQLRLLAHYMEDPEFTQEVLTGDVHQKNADILSKAVNSLKSSTSHIAIERALAKPFIFAFLYGAGGAKLARILGLSERIGAALKEQFQKAYPKLDSLINDTKFDVASTGFIVGLDGRPVFCETEHKALNYLIQSAEAIVMKLTILMIEERFKEELPNAKILLFYHDEVTYEVDEADAERAREIMIECFEEAPKEVGIDFMTCGDCKIGNDYYEVH